MKFKEGDRIVQVTETGVHVFNSNTKKQQYIDLTDEPAEDPGSQEAIEWLHDVMVYGDMKEDPVHRKYWLDWCTKYLSKESEHA